MSSNSGNKIINMGTNVGVIIDKVISEHFKILNELTNFKPDILPFLTHELANSVDTIINEFVRDYKFNDLDITIFSHKIETVKLKLSVLATQYNILNNLVSNIFISETQSESKYKILESYEKIISKLDYIINSVLDIVHFDLALVNNSIDFKFKSSSSLFKLLKLRTELTYTILDYKVENDIF